MEAKDTVMDFKQFKEVYNGKEWKPVVELQAEISFNAGIKEVANWINRNSYLGTINPDDTGELLRDLQEIDWQAKLKEWGIE